MWYRANRRARRSGSLAALLVGFLSPTIQAATVCDEFTDVERRIECYSTERCGDLEDAEKEACYQEIIRSLLSERRREDTPGMEKAVGSEGPGTTATPSGMRAESSSGEAAKTSSTATERMQGSDRPDAFGRKRSEDQSGRQISSAIVSLIRQETGAHIIALNNGQIWEELERNKVHLDLGMSVTISRGLLGSFVMKSATTSSFRVRRLDCELHTPGREDAVKCAEIGYPGLYEAADR